MLCELENRQEGDTRSQRDRNGLEGERKGEEGRKNETAVCGLREGKKDGEGDEEERL